MSDGITEARRGTYFSGPTGYSGSTGHPNPPTPNHTPDPKWHKIISFIKSGVRILGYAIIPFDLVIATGVLILSEVIGIIEELV
jgi:hypothetical protein